MNAGFTLGTGGIEEGPGVVAGVGPGVGIGCHLLMLKKMTMRVLAP